MMSAEEQLAVPPSVLQMIHLHQKIALTLSELEYERALQEEDIVTLSKACGLTEKEFKEASLLFLQEASLYAKANPQMLRALEAAGLNLLPADPSK